ATAFGRPPGPRSSTDLTRSSAVARRRTRRDGMTTSDPIAPTTPIEALLTDEMLARFDERAPQYDRENRFFDEDFAELRDSGYMSCALPVEYGGAGLALHGYTRVARRLAYVAPATALALNMHIYWTGLA